MLSIDLRCGNHVLLCGIVFQVDTIGSERLAIRHSSYTFTIGFFVLESLSGAFTDEILFQLGCTSHHRQEESTVTVQVVTT